MSCQRILRSVAAVVFFSLSMCPLAPAQEPLEPNIADASEDARTAMAGFQVPSGMKVELFAAEPLLANPVAFCLDAQGRVYVCESFRQNQGITDNRNHDQEWLDADLAAQTVEDRLVYHRRLLGDKVQEYTLQDDRIRLVEDTDSDGVADRSSVFADHFNQIVDGSGAGVLARGGDVYFTCIPNLWLLRDEDHNGQAEVRVALHTGYGVRVAFRGHDLHGLCMGPDGRLYFSVGDRGYNVETHEGKRLADPESGAVFRCNLDGSNLEVFATGLRNPQELAFDQYGNLFTGDNNSDSGDRARWVYVVEGGDSGWRMAYQYLPDRGPFNREQIWHPFHPEQPAYIVPPIANVADGPSGLAYYPGVGLDERFEGRFLLCDFRGGPADSGVRIVRVEPRGAFFDLVESEKTLWGVLATDVEFGPDGGVYVSDWVNGWNGEGKGRIYRYSLNDPSSDPRIKEVQQLLKEGFENGRAVEDLEKLLAHADQRVRVEAQFALAARGEEAALIRAAHISPGVLGRLHGIWGWGQILRRTGGPDKITRQFVDELKQLLKDKEPQVRAHTARIVGDAHLKIDEVHDILVELLRDENMRVRQFAAEALGKVGEKSAFNPLVEMLVENADQDPIVRHAGIMGLAGLNDQYKLVELTSHPSRAARLAAVVALRKCNSHGVAEFLNDADVSVVVEAARAIHDVPIERSLPQLAALVDSAPDNDALLRRVLNANYRLGSEEHAQAIARLAARQNLSDVLRREAVTMLATWAEPSGRDRVLGMWRPIAARDAAPAREALQQHIAAILAGGNERVRTAALDAAAKLGAGETAPLLKNVFLDSDSSGDLRATALTALATLRSTNVKELATSGISDSQPQVRIAARHILARLTPLEVLDSLREAIEAPDQRERQAAIATLAEMKRSEADQILAMLVARMLDNDLPPEIRLDALEAARARQKDAEIARLLERYQQHLDPQNPVSAYQETMHGGDAERGRRIFFERTEVSCVRCHTVGDTGGEVGPDLTKIAAQKDRRYLLESLVDPSKTIAENFRTAIIIDEDGHVLTGIVKQEDDQRVQLVTAEGAIINVNKDAIEERSEGASAMPQDLLKHLSGRDVRDLVEWLSTLK